MKRIGEVSIEMKEEVHYEPIARELTIHYKCGEKFHVKHPEDISVGYDRGGRILLCYSKDYQESAEFSYGQAQFLGAIRYYVNTGDIKSLEFDFGLTYPDRGIRRKLVLEIS